MQVPALDGLLFYGKGTSTATISTAGTSPPDAPIDGAIYFPNAAVLFTGNATNPSNCSPLVAAAMTLFSTFSLDTSGCAGFSTAITQMQGARVVE
jgi:hypothetical protein